MIRNTTVLLGLTTIILLSGCQEDESNEVNEPDTVNEAETVTEPKIGTPEEQIAKLQEDFNEIIGEADSEYGKLVFYSLENEDSDRGVGLAIFDEEEGEWVYSKGTAHLGSNSPEVTSFPSGRIELNEEVKVVYGYMRDSSIEEIQEVKSEELMDDTLRVSESIISYTFVSPEQDITILPN